MDWKTVRTSWKPSGRLPRTSRRRFIFAKAGTVTSRMKLARWYSLWKISRLVVAGDGFLRHAMLALRELFFEFSDFFAFDIRRKRAAPFHERLFPFGGSKIGAAGFCVNVPEMGVNG